MLIIYQDHAEVIQGLNDLNREIHQTINERFVSWQSMIEKRGVDLQIQLNTLVKDLSDPLLQKIQQKLGRLFECQFKLTTISLAPLQPASPISNVSLVQVKSSQVKETREIEVTVPIKKKRKQGGCFGVSYLTGPALT